MFRSTDPHAAEHWLLLGDNTGTEYALWRGWCRQPDICALMERFWMETSHRPWRSATTWWVSTHHNWADGPSRGRGGPPGWPRRKWRWPTHLDLAQLDDAMPADATPPSGHAE